MASKTEPTGLSGQKISKDAFDAHLRGVGAATGNTGGAGSSKSRRKGVAGDNASPMRSRMAGTPKKEADMISNPIRPVIRGLPPIGRP